MSQNCPWRFRLRTRPPIEEIKREGQARILEVLGALGVSWRQQRGNYISICNPMVPDKHPSFTIWIRGAAVGAFKDHRGCAEGDLIDLVAYLRGDSAGNDKAGRKEAIEWLAGFLGLRDLSLADRMRLANKHRVNANAAQARASHDLAVNQEKARATFYRAAPILGSLADTYLQSRAIELVNMRRVPGILRFLPATDPMAYHAESARGLPCMLAGCYDWHTGKIKAVHRTWLKPDGSGKADIDPVKKVWPAFAGLVIPIWRGAGDLPLDAAMKETAEHGVYETLMLTEGIEDALTSVMREPEYRTWAFISLGNLGRVELPPSVDRVILHQHYEPTNKAAAQSFANGKRALWQQGEIEITVRQVRDPREGKDFNDEWRAEQARRKSSEAKLRDYQGGKR
jgi:hypothetical protein